MEEYRVLNNLNNDEQLTLHWNYEQVFKTHVDIYGENAALKIFKNVEENYQKSIRQIKSNDNHNILMVGKVQSGKTSNLEMFTAIAFDNDYNIVIIYGGYDNYLLNQTANRFKKTFAVKNDIDDDSPLLFTTSDDESELTDTALISDALEEGKRLIIVSMKRPLALEKVNKSLKELSKKKIRPFIIDDEGDQASINISKNMNQKDIDTASATYKSICTMKNITGNPMYLSVTATPQANIFLNNYSYLKPGCIILASSGEGYLGTNEFHQNFDHIIEINDVDEDDNNGYGNESLRNAICHFLISSAIMQLRNNKRKSDMIIHSFREVAMHDILFTFVQDMIDVYQQDSKRRPGTSSLKYDLVNIFNSKYFSEEILHNFDIEYLYNFIITNTLKRTYVVLRNSGKNATDVKNGANLRPHQIHIGGDLLQRGITFDNLVTTYYTRWAKKGNMDTSLQRARWFGYRQSYFDLCRIFTTTKISNEFIGLGEMEDDLWEQFRMIQDGNLTVEDIVIQADGTDLFPTSREKVQYSSVEFNTKWYNQTHGIFDIITVEKNNNFINNFLVNLSMQETKVGRRDGGISAYYANISSIEFMQLYKNLSSIFTEKPFVGLDKVISQKYHKIIFENLSYNKVPRKRTFIDAKISYLKQGATSTDESKITYEGDNRVVVDEDAIIIQMSLVCPMNEEKKLREEYTQYMFAIHFPYKKRAFVKGG